MDKIAELEEMIKDLFDESCDKEKELLNKLGEIATILNDNNKKIIEFERTFNCQETILTTRKARIDLLESMIRSIVD